MINYSGHKGRTERDRQRQIINMIKLNRGCAICGYNDIARALDFHHIDPKTKVKGIAQMLMGTETITEILQEIEKCEVLCSNCHRVISKKW